MPRKKRNPYSADCKDGYTRIANRILEALPLARISGTQKSICLLLFRRTYGWNRGQDAISLREFAAACQTSTCYISRQIADLLRKNIIRRLAFEPGKTPVYAFVADFEEWAPGAIDLEELAANEAAGVYRCSPEGRLERLIIRRGGLSSETGVNAKGLPDRSSHILPAETNQGLSVAAMAKEEPIPAPPGWGGSVNKDINTGKTIHFYKEGEEEFDLASLLLTRIREILPGLPEPDLQGWARSMDGLLKNDRRSPEEVREVILFAQSHRFWQTNTLNVDSLRRHYDRINLMRLQQRQPPARARTAKEKRVNAVESDRYERFFK